MSESVDPGSPKKICTLCGKDVAGQPRVKDREGRYYCLACDEAEKDRLHGGRFPCAECKRFFRRDKLMEHGSDLVCEPCAQLRHQRYRALRTSGMDIDLRRARQVQRLALVVILLLILALVLWAVR